MQGLKEREEAEEIGRKVYKKGMAREKDECFVMIFMEGVCREDDLRSNEWTIGRSFEGSGADEHEARGTREGVKRRIQNQRH